MAKTIMISLDQIENRFDVRTILDEDRVLQIVGMYEAGLQVPPIKVVQLDDNKYAYVDGRHRGNARAYCNLKDVEAIVISNPNDPAELFAQALESNYGGSKPPTRDDITHTITRMLELGATQTSINERLNFLPKGALRAYISSARGTIMKRKITRALDAIGEGSKINEAAKEFKIPLENLKDIVQGKKGKWGKGRSNEVETGIAMKSYISTSLRSANSGISKKMEGLLAQVDSGEVSYKVAYDVLKAWGEHLRKTALRVADWKARLNAISGEQDKFNKEVA